MSTRYVWGKYNYTTPPLSYNDHPSLAITTYQSIKACSKFGRDMITVPAGENLGFVPEGNVKILDSVGDKASCSDYPYVIVFRKDWDTKVGYGIGVSSYGDWEVKSTPELYVYNISGGVEQNFDYATAQEVSKDEFVSKQSSQSSGAYPKSGVQGSYFYEYIGSDSIDPSSVTYSTSSPVYGSSIAIRATTSNPTYGGTIYYQFSYSIDGGNSWTDIGSKSTATSASVTIPSGATQFMGRVIASDDWGFTSTTYVTGSNLTVSKPITYYRVTLSASPSEGGTVSGSGSYASGSYATVRATPNDGYKFVRWAKGGSTVSASSSYRFIVSGNTSLTAVFEEEIKAYVGVNAKAGSLKKGYVGVTAKARSLVKGYVGVGGVAKKLF